MTETTTNLVQQGLTAARVGDVEEAQQLLREATRRAPHNVEAWLGLASVEESLKEKKRCFEKVLAIDPDNDDAEAGLDLVNHKLAEEAAPVGVEGVTACYRHPDVETGLRCNRCGKPICPKCANRTPVGFRCPDCIREQEDKYYTGGNFDYLIGAVIAFPLSLMTAFIFVYLLGSLPFLGWIISFIAAAPAGGIIAEAVRWGVQKRRSRYLGHVAAGSFVLAVAPFALFFLFVGAFFGAIIPAILLFLGTGAIWARLR